MDAYLLNTLKDLSLALLLGALMGLERERSGGHIAGMRTFPLISLAGGICVVLGQLAEAPWFLAVGFIAIVALTVMANLLQARKAPDPGLTTEIAILVCYCVGALLLYRQTILAISIAFATTAILYFKPHLHAFSRKVQKRDIYAIFQLGLISFIILPILPNRNYGPFEALNPHHIWLMVVLISGISFMGYLVLKLAGNRWGGPTVGFLGGLVSSTATTLSFSRHSRANPQLCRTAAVVIILASSVLFVRVAIEIAVIHPELLRQMALPLALMFGAGLIAAVLVWTKSSPDQALVLEPRNPAELTSALTFGLLYGVVLLAVAAGKHYLGSNGLYAVSLIAGLTDVDAITLSSARFAKLDILSIDQARNAILLAILANLAFKLTVVSVIGPLRLTQWTALGFAAMALVALALW